MLSLLCRKSTKCPGSGIDRCRDEQGLCKGAPCNSESPIPMCKPQAEQQALVWGKQSAASGCGAQSPVKFMLARVPCNLSSSARAISGLQQHRAQQSGCTSASNLYACRGVV